MTPTPGYLRGAVLKCRFPYDHSPRHPGPQPHYCLFIEQLQGIETPLIALCYGTSRLDQDLLRAHQGAVLSVPSTLVRGAMPGHVTHFVCDHVALVPESWIYKDFNARLDFIRPDSRVNDPNRQHLYRQFEALEPIMVQATLDALKTHRRTGLPGLPTDSALR